MKKLISTSLLAVVVLLSLPNKVWACACGCFIFDVSTSAMLPTQAGGMVFAEYDFMNQDQNWHGLSSAPAANNDDKEIRTHFFTLGAQYMFNRSWGAEVDIPFWQRHFVTTDDTSGSIVSFDHLAFGDIRVKGIYSGLSEDMSSGLTFGFKLPTGDHTYANFDRDTEIGTGSTDILLGGYHMGNISGKWNWFGIGDVDQPVLIQGGYRPGTEIDAVSGIYYNGWNIGSVKVAPVAQAIGSFRLHDRGSASDPANSGYERFILTPGIEVDTGNFKIYGDVGFPVLQHFHGDQLVAQELFKFNVSYSF